MDRPPLPPFVLETALQKSGWPRTPGTPATRRGWRSPIPRQSLAHRAEFLQGREAIQAFLKRKWDRELDYHLIKELWAFRDIASRCVSPTSAR